MKEFMDIMKLMNNGLNNESTLKDTYPLIIKLGLVKNPNNIDRVTAWMLEEACFREHHPGLDQVVDICHEIVPNKIVQNLEMKAK